MATALASGFFISQTGSLNSFLRIGYGVLESGRGVTQSCIPTSMRASFIIWNMIRMPLALLAQQLADTVSVFAEVQSAGRRSLDAHLVLDVSCLDVVELAREPSSLTRTWNDEDGDPRGAGGSLRSWPGRDG